MPTKKIKIGNITIGGGNKVAIQSMTNSDTADFDKTLAQLYELEMAGCDIARFTVPDMESVRNIAKFKEKIKMPLVADIHFNYKLAVEAAHAGIDKIRINPGNIGSDDRIKAVCDACRQRNIPIRIGVNGGSLEKSILEKYQKPTPEALYESALLNVKKLEQFDFNDIVISVKSSDVITMIKANRLLSSNTDYPLHIGVTEAGTTYGGIIKSSAGIGALLCDGIGDTVRVSLTADIKEEIRAAKELLMALGIEKNGIELVSCPTCGRCKINLIEIADEFGRLLAEKNFKPQRRIKVAIMGCAVNGPGEAREADVGVAGGAGDAILFKKGETIGKLDADKIIPTLLDEVEKLCK
ncbi:MAG: flavodoxin-dependent (E)-4-hydroxy-3-methylbut-2-enyl-diphosphate synthase [Ruminococcaceae bacterium]|nr:flavodoxin-dependent (E)-4-hydroxy-3-methylbut-2-enyl-diphosphate synthase [Oscillospiraceae bacterium]